MLEMKLLRANIWHFKAALWRISFLCNLAPGNIKGIFSPFDVSNIHKEQSPSSVQHLRLSWTQQSPVTAPLARLWFWCLDPNPHWEWRPGAVAALCSRSPVLLSGTFVNHRFEAEQSKDIGVKNPSIWFWSCGPWPVMGSHRNRTQESPNILTLKWFQICYLKVKKLHVVALKINIY